VSIFFIFYKMTFLSLIANEEMIEIEFKENQRIEEKRKLFRNWIKNENEIESPFKIA
jgi:hypothetical protein